MGLPYSFPPGALRCFQDDRPPQTTGNRFHPALVVVGAALVTVALGVAGFEALRHFDGMDTGSEPDAGPDADTDHLKTGTVRPADEDASGERDRDLQRGKGRTLPDDDKGNGSEDATASGGKGELAYVTKLIAEAKSFDEAMEILQAHPNIHIDEILATTLFKLVKNYDDGIEFLELVRDNDLTLNVYYYNRVITFTNDLGQAMKVLNLMTDAGVHPDNRTFNDFFKFARGYRDGMSIIDLMIQYHVTPDVYSFTKLMGLAENFDQTTAILDRMAEYRVAPNEVTFRMAFRLVRTYDQGFELLGRMHDAGVVPDVYEFNAVLNRARDFSQAFRVIDTMLIEGVPPNNASFTKLLDYARTKADADQVYRLLRSAIQAGFEPDEMLRGRMKEWGYDV